MHYDNLQKTPAETLQDTRYDVRKAYAPNDDSNQTAHPRSLILVFVVHMKKLCILVIQVHPWKILITLYDCASWYEFSLGARVRRYFFWYSGLNKSSGNY